MLAIGGSIHGKDLVLRDGMRRVSVPVRPAIKFSFQQPTESFHSIVKSQEYTVRRYIHAITFKVPEWHEPGISFATWVALKIAYLDIGGFLEGLVHNRYGTIAIYREYLVFEGSTDAQLELMVEELVYGPGF